MKSSFVRSLLAIAVFGLFAALPVSAFAGEGCGDSCDCSKGKEGQCKDCKCENCDCDHEHCDHKK